jgi:hypothetical protein
VKAKMAAERIEIMVGMAEIERWEWMTGTAIEVERMGR